MAIEYAIEKLKQSEIPEDQQHAATLSGVLAARGSIDIPLPESTASVTSTVRPELAAHLGGTGIRLMDDTENAPSILSAHEIDTQTTNRYYLSNSVKEVLQPFYTASSLKLPTLKDSDKSWFSALKSSEAKLEWTASDRITIARGGFGRPNHSEGTLRYELGLTYERGKYGNTPVELRSQLRINGNKVSRKDPVLEIGFEESSVSTLKFTRGKNNDVHSNVKVPSFFGSIREAEINLNPDELGIAVKYDAHTGSVGDSWMQSGSVNYTFDAKLNKFIAEDYNENLLKDAGLQTSILPEKFIEITTGLAEKFVPTK